MQTVNLLAIENYPKLPRIGSSLSLENNMSQDAHVFQNKTEHAAKFVDTGKSVNAKPRAIHTQ